MNILIKGMEMPHDCAECPLDWNECEYINGFDTVDHSDKKRPDNCPLVEIPPHGRLIDADELIARHGDWYTEQGTEVGFIGTVKNLVDAQPTVIEAEG